MSSHVMTGGDHSSRTPLARRLQQPTRTSTRRRVCCAEAQRGSLFGLAPGGACRAPFLAVGAVRSYRTVSPLPGPRAWRSVLCCAFPGVTPAGRYPAPCLHGARTFLDGTVSSIAAAAARPPDRRLDRSGARAGQGYGAGHPDQALPQSPRKPFRYITTPKQPTAHRSQGGDAAFFRRKFLYSNYSCLKKHTQPSPTGRATKMPQKCHYLACELQILH